MKKKNIIIIGFSLSWIFLTMACSCDLGSLLNSNNPSTDPWEDSNNGNSIRIQSTKEVIFTTEPVDAPSEISTKVDTQKTSIPNLETLTPQSNNNSADSGLPSAPNGFIWKSLPEISLLIPDGWFFRSESTDNTVAYFVSKEEIIKSTDNFGTGLTVNIVNNVTNTDAAAKKAIDNAANNSNVTQVLYQSSSYQGADKVSELRVEIKDPTVKNGDPKQPKIVYYLSLSRPTHKSIVFVYFEADKLSWDTEWEKGKELLTHLAFVDE